MNRTCAQCSYFVAEDRSDGKGQCRRRSPRIPIVKEQADGSVKTLTERWPTVSHEEWCGEWELHPKLKPPKEAGAFL